MPLVDLVDQWRQQRTDLDRPIAPTGALLGDGEHLPLGLVDQIPGRAAVIGEGRRCNRAAGRDQAPQERALADDLRIGADIGRGRRVARQAPQVGETAGSFQPAIAVQVFRGCDHVGGLAAGDQLGQRTEYQLVVGAVEIVSDDDVANLVPGRRVDEQPANDRLLRFHRMRWRQRTGVARPLGITT